MDADNKRYDKLIVCYKYIMVTLGFTLFAFLFWLLEL